MTHAKTGALTARGAPRRHAPNKKLLAAAVAAAVAPAGAFTAAHAEFSVYGRVANHIDVNDAVQDNPFTLNEDEGFKPRFGNLSGSGRFGVKYDGTVGPGLNTHARYEFSTTTDKEEPGVNDTRIATLGVSGLFGRIDVGNQWSSYFNTFGTLVSPTYSLGYYLYSSVGGGAFRTSNTIKYSNSFGPVSTEFDFRFNGSDETADTAETLRGDGYGIGVSVALSKRFSVAVAIDSEERADGEPAAGTLGDFTADGTAGNRIVGTYTGYNPGSQKPDEDRLGISAKANFANGYWLSLGWQNYATDDLPSLSAKGDGHPLDFNDDGDTADLNEASAPRTVTRPGKDINSLFLYGGGKFSPDTSWLVGFAMADDSRAISTIGIAADDELEVFSAPAQGDSQQLTWGVYHNVGAGFNLYYEASRLEIDAKYRDGVVHLLGMRVRF